MTLMLTSENFSDGDRLDSQHVLSKDFGFGCSGGNLSPQLSWSGAPSATKSYAVTCFDPDAPTGCGFWHWLVVNIPADVNSLALGAGDPAKSLLPAGAIHTRTDFGKPAYCGPCPPENDNIHRYIFTVYAVGQDSLPVEAETSGAVVAFNLHFNTLEKARLIGLYRR